jgi:acyl carrier protein
MEFEAIEQQIVEIVATFLGRSVTSGASRELDADWDSLKHIQIIFAVEDRFGIQMSEEEMSKCDTVKRLVEAVERHRAA